MHGKFAAAKVSTFVVSDFCVFWDFDCQRLCITPPPPLGQYAGRLVAIRAVLYRHTGDSRVFVLPGYSEDKLVNGWS